MRRDQGLLSYPMLHKYMYRHAMHAKCKPYIYTYKCLLHFGAFRLGVMNLHVPAPIYLNRLIHTGQVVCDDYATFIVPRIALTFLAPVPRAIRPENLLLCRSAAIVPNQLRAGRCLYIECWW